MNEFVIKNGFISKGDSTVNNDLTVNGVLYSNTISASTYQNLPIDPNYYITGGTVSGTDLLLNRNDGNTVTIDTSPYFDNTDSFVTGGTATYTGPAHDNNNITLTLNNGQSNVTISNIEDTFVNGGTYNSGTLTLDRNDGNSVVVTGFTSGGGGSTAPITIGWDGQGGFITTGLTRYFVAPYNATITGWSIVAEGTNPTCTIDVWKIASGTALPTVANTITASAIPALSTGNVVRSSTLTGWTTSITAGDILAFNIDSVSNALTIKINLEL